MSLYPSRLSTCVLELIFDSLVTGLIFIDKIHFWGFLGLDIL